MKKINLYLHIGHGKTGTTSIQQFFRKNRCALEEEGYLYTGLFFEELNDYVETISSVQEIFNRISGKECLESDIEEVVSNLLKYSNENNISNLVWINEAILTNPKKFVPIIKRFENSFNIKIICYLRDQYSWFSSSYKQWGVKDKSYQGDVKSFEEWCVSQKWQGMYFNLLSPWVSGFGRDSLIVRNYVEIKDVLGDFLSILGFKGELKINKNRSNVSDTSAILSYYKIFNSNDYESNGYLMANEILRKTDIASHLINKATSLFTIPDYEDVSDLFKDFQANNDLLFELVGSKLPVVSGSRTGVRPSEAETLSLLMGLIIELSKKLNIVENKLSEIERES